MANLLFYHVERLKQDDCYKVNLTHEEARIVFDKLRRHYKVRVSLYWRPRMRGGGSYHGGYNPTISLPAGKGTNFRVLCHEMAHALEKQKHGSTKHRKRLLRIIGRVCDYCRKHEFWQAELRKRTEPRVPAPDPTPDEERATKLQQLRLKVLGYEHKLQRTNKLYQGKLQRARRRIAALERQERIQAEKRSQDAAEAAGRASGARLQEDGGMVSDTLLPQRDDAVIPVLDIDLAVPLLHDEGRQRP